MPLEEIALPETTNPAALERIQTARAFKTRVILRDRDIVLTEEPLADLAAQHAFRGVPVDPVVATGLPARGRQGELDAALRQLGTVAGELPGPVELHCSARLQPARRRAARRPRPQGQVADAPPSGRDATGTLRPLAVAT